MASDKESLAGLRASSGKAADVSRSVLIFDVGANVGGKAARFLARGARVVCFEPVPECLQALQLRFAGNPAVTIAPCALGAASGRLPIAICSEATTVSTFSDAWKQGRFKNMVWDRSLEVPVETLDMAIAKHGLPDYCKIDVEGFELSVLQGLSLPIPVVSFEFCREGLAQALACLDRLGEIGYRRFNIAYGEVEILRHDHWIDAPTLMAELRDHPVELAWGDIYAARDDAPSVAVAAVIPSVPLNDEVPARSSNTLDQLLWRGLAYPGAPLRLHLGAGEQILRDYVNIDYPSERHNVMKVRPELAADITTLAFPPNCVDEVRLHHVFEHFNRVVALGLLIRWQRWLKPGGGLHMETPDFAGEAQTFLQDLPDLAQRQSFLTGPLRRLMRRGGQPQKRSFSDRMSAIRSLEGDQTAAWGYHVGHWFAERFQQTLGSLGFENISIEQNLSGHVPALHNLSVTATKGADRSEDEQLEAAYALLWHSTVAEAERPTWEIWCAQLRQFLRADQLPNVPLAHAVVPGDKPIRSAPRRIAPPSPAGSDLESAIAVRLNGGLGNQLFQYAAGRAASLRLGTSLLLDVSRLQADPQRRFHLSAFKIAGEIVSDTQRLEANLARYDERSYHYDEAFEAIERGTVLVGYFQSERYFCDYSSQIRADIEPSGPLSSVFETYASAIRASALPVSIHIRRGDMAADPKTAEFHGICGEDYYRRALDVIRGLVGVGPNYFIFSDDRAAAARLSNICGSGVLVETDPARPWEDMILMSLCRHHVLANSSFSWWGSWRNSRPDKIVVAPRYWVAPKALRGLNTADLYPEGAIIISERGRGDATNHRQESS